LKQKWVAYIWHFCDKTLPFSKTDIFGLVSLMRIPVHGRVKKPRFKILSLILRIKATLQLVMI